MGRWGKRWTQVPGGEYLQSEDALLTQVLELASLFGWYAFHPRPARTVRGWRTAFQGDAGFPDVVLARGPQAGRRGRLLFIECKSERGTLSPTQIEWMTVLQSINGIEYYLWRPSDVDDIPKILGES